MAIVESSYPANTGITSMAVVESSNRMIPIKWYTCQVCHQKFSCSHAIGGHTKGHMKMPCFVSKREKARIKSVALKEARAAKKRIALALKEAKARAKASKYASVASLQTPPGWTAMFQRMHVFNQQYGVLVKTDVGGELIYAPPNKQSVEKLDLTLRLGPS